MKNSQNLEKLLNKQIELSNLVVLDSPFKSLTDIHLVAGLDLHYKNNNYFVAACVIFSFPDLVLIEKRALCKKLKNAFPYIPGFLSFREVPPLIEILKTVKNIPDVILCDGQGIAHPRKIGLASHLGILINKPTIGCAKSHLYGRFEEPPPGLRGGYQFIKDDNGDILGIVLRTKPYIKPIFVSPGHLIDVETAGDIVLKCSTRYRIPEPLRLAHNLAKNYVKIIK